MGRRVILSFTLLLATARSPEAQTSADNLRVRIESGATRLGGALVALVDERDRVLSEQLSSEAGVAVLAAPPGQYRVRVRRIGFRPFYSEPVTVPRSTELLLLVESPRVTLNSLVVSAPSQCGRINRDAPTLSALWEEISKALRASQLTPTDLDRLSRKHMYRREIGTDGMIISGDSSDEAVSNKRPFGSPDPTSLALSGYVRGDQERGWIYFGPDEAVLLSDGFASTHCFRAVRDRKRPYQIGMAYEPTPRRRQSDIKGVIWLDEASSELREIVFRYVNAGILTQFEPGGFSRFSRMPSGAWIVSEWQLRMPLLRIKVGLRPEVSAGGYVENGGRVIAARD